MLRSPRSRTTVAFAAAALLVAIAATLAPQTPRATRDPRRPTPDTPAAAAPVVIDNTGPFGPTPDASPTPAALLPLLRDCLHRAPFTGRGVGGSPLVLERARISRTGYPHRYLVSIPETQVTTAPTGRDLVVDLIRDGCIPAPMD